MVQFNLDLSFIPSLGDLCVDPLSTSEDALHGLVSIYFGDNRERPRWGSICHNSIDKAVGNVMCRQLGYTSGFITPTTSEL